MANLTKYSIGEPYIANKTAWPQAYEYNYSQGSHTLRMFVRTLHSKEIEGIREGKAQFALTIIGDIIFLHFRFAGAFDWSDCPYSIHMVDKDLQELPNLDFEPDIGAILTVFLVDAENGILKAMRVLTFNHRFTMKLHQAIIDQYHRPFNQADYERQVIETYKCYTSKQLLMKSIAKTTAGVK